MSKQISRSIVILLVLILQLGSAASLWSKDSRSPIVKKNNFKIGDTVTVLIDESLNAAQSGTTKSDKSTDTNLGLTNRSDVTDTLYGQGRGKVYKGGGDARLNLTAGGKDTFTGTGKTTRETTIKSTMTATVIDVQPNGNLFILGQREIKVNNEVETLEISGIVSLDKLSDDNTILSTQIANAKITVKGTGVVSSQQQPGMIAKMFEWLF